VTAQADGTAKEMALRAAPLADEALTAAWALVHSLCHHRAAPLELLAQTLQIRELRLMTKAESELLMCARALACTR
jgi:hypothetical protein